MTFLRAVVLVSVLLPVASGPVRGREPVPPAPRPLTGGRWVCQEADDGWHDVLAFDEQGGFVRGKVIRPQDDPSEAVRGRYRYDGAGVTLYLTDRPYRHCVVWLNDDTVRLIDPDGAASTWKRVRTP
jgi:hypothetical protein